MTSVGDRPAVDAEGPPVAATAVPGALVEIDAVAPITHGGSLAGQSVDSPTAAQRIDRYVLPISGWVYVMPTPVRRVHVLADGRALCTVPVKFVRPDVNTRFSAPAELAVGFSTELGVLGLPASFELQVAAELEDGSLIPFAAISGRRRPLAPAPPRELRPIFVTNIGRCGSTLLMNLLRGHPRIVVHDLYPYETRALSYWMHMLKVLADPADHARSADPNSYEDDPFWVGRHPHNMRPVVDPAVVGDWLRGEYVDNLARFCQTSAEEFYTRVARAQGTSEPVYFAEKRNPRATARLASELYPGARELFLIRDPRDMVCSMLSFYDKTRLVSFGRDRNDSDEQFVREIAVALRDLVGQLHERADRSLLVRYEDLIASPAEQLERMLAYLELPTPDAVQASMLERGLADTDSSRGHRTTPTVAASVGRWQRDLDPATQATCSTAFGELVEQLGYSPSG